MKTDYTTTQQVTIISIPDTINNILLIGKTGTVIRNDGEGCFVEVDGDEWYFEYENLEEK